MPFTDAPDLRIIDGRPPTYPRRVRDDRARALRALTYHTDLPGWFLEDLRSYDLWLLAVTVARSNALEDIEIRLIQEMGNVPARYDRRSLRLAYVLGGLTLATLCGFGWFIAYLVFG